MTDYEADMIENDFESEYYEYEVDELTEMEDFEQADEYFGGGCEYL